MTHKIGNILWLRCSSYGIQLYCAADGASAQVVQRSCEFSFLSTFRSHLNVVLGILLRVSLLEQRLEQMDKMSVQILILWLLWYHWGGEKTGKAFHCVAAHRWYVLLFSVLLSKILSFFFFYDVNYWESRRASQTILVLLMKLSHFKHLSCKITYLFSFLLQWNFGSEQHCLLINLSPWMIPLQATNLDKVEKVLKWAKAYLIFNSQFRV